MNWFSRFSRQRGVSVVEFTYLLPLLLFVFVSLVDYAWAFHQLQRTRDAARTAASHVVEGSAVASCSDLIARTLDYLESSLQRSGIDPSQWGAASGQQPSPVSINLHVEDSVVLQVMTISLQTSAGSPPCLICAPGTSSELNLSVEESFVLWRACS